MGSTSDEGQILEVTILATRWARREHVSLRVEQRAPPLLERRRERAAAAVAVGEERRVERASRRAARRARELARAAVHDRELAAITAVVARRGWRRAQAAWRARTQVSPRLEERRAAQARARAARAALLRGRALLDPARAERHLGETVAAL